MARPRLIEFDEIDLLDFRPVRLRGPDDTLARARARAQNCRRTYYLGGGNKRFVIHTVHALGIVAVIRIQ